MREIELRRFNSQGLDAAIDIIAQLQQGEEIDLDCVLVDPLLTEVVSKDLCVTVIPFKNRFEAASYFYSLLEPVEGSVPEVQADRGLWTWLSLVWFDVLAPVQPDGSRKLGDAVRWIPQTDNWQRYYRHLLVGPYMIFQAHKDDPARAMAVLATPVNRPGDVVENIASRQEFVASPGLMSAATELYYDNVTGSLKRGSASKNGLGDSRRLAAVVNQFDLTWDVFGMSASEILQLLPAEFRRFMQPAGEGSAIR